MRHNIKRCYDFEMILHMSIISVNRVISENGISGYEKL